MEVPDQLNLAIRLARETEGESGALGVFAREMSRLLTATAERLEADGAPPRASRRQAGAAEYVVEGEGTAEVLTEYRLSGKSKPFRCPKSFYDAVAGVLATEERPLSVEEIASGVEKEIGDRPADFQVRVPLRLWLSLDPPLVIRIRARYRISGKLRPAAIWDQLRQRS